MSRPNTHRAWKPFASACIIAGSKRWRCCLAAAALFCASAVLADDEVELIEFNPPPEMELNLLIQMVSDELSLKIMVDERAGSQRVKMLIPESIPKSSLRGLLESALQMQGFALTEGAQPGWLRVVEARDLLDIAPPPEEAGDDDPAKKATAALTRVFKIKHYDPQKAEQVIEPYLTDPGGNLQLISEQRLLIVTDYAPRVARIAKLLELVDQPKADVEVRFWKLTHLQADEAASELSRVLQAKLRAQAAGLTSQGMLGLEIIPQLRTNRLVLIGEESRLEGALALLESIDVDLGLETRLYRFSSAEPSAVNDLVLKLIDPKAAERLYRSSTDTANKLLIVTTTPGIHKQVASVQADLDREIEAVKPVFRFYKLLNAKASDVLSTIQRLERVTVLQRMPAAPDKPGNPRFDDGLEPGRDRGPAPASERLRERPSAENQPPTDSVRDGWQIGGPGSSAYVGLQPSLQTEDATITTDENTNTIIVFAEPDRQSFYADLIEKLDKRRPQVMIEVTLIAMNTSDGKSVGVEISRTGDDDDEPRVLSFSNFGLADSTDPADLLAASGLGFNGVILSEDIANVVIRALKTDGSSKVISTPKLLINDNTQGTLSSTLNISYLETNSFASGLNQSVGGSSSAGTSISLTPQISEGDHIKLLSNVEFSSFGQGGSDFLPPPVSSQNVSSEVTIPDGHTVVIGGLNSTDYGESVSRVPILGQIPVLEYLFSSRSSNSSETTFFVFIKPVIMRDDGFAGLKFMTQRDLDTAGLPGDFPVSEPLLME